MVRTSDGFEIAEKDLELRGPGEFFGTRQAGMPSLRVANLIRDRKLLELAKAEARGLLDDQQRRGNGGGEANGRAVSARRTGTGAMGWWRLGKARNISIADMGRGARAVSCTLDGMIVGIGVDLCEVERMELAIRAAWRALSGPHLYGSGARYCESKPNRMERFAGRFAAKEAAMKAIGTGWSRGVGWRDFEVTRAASGQPVICLPWRGAQNCGGTWGDAGAGVHHPHQEHGDGASGAGGGVKSSCPAERVNCRAGLL